MLTNPQGNVWNLLFQEIMRITSLRKDSIQSTITTWCTGSLRLLGRKINFTNWKTLVHFPVFFACVSFRFFMFFSIGLCVTLACVSVRFLFFLFFVLAFLFMFSCLFRQNEETTGKNEKRTPPKNGNKSYLFLNFFVGTHTQQKNKKKKKKKKQMKNIKR